MSGETKILHWFIQKPEANNCPIGQSKPLDHQGAVFQEHPPTVALKGCEWIKVVPASAVETLLTRLTNTTKSWRESLEEYSRALTTASTKMGEAQGHAVMLAIALDSLIRKAEDTGIHLDAEKEILQNFQKAAPLVSQKGDK